MLSPNKKNKLTKQPPSPRSTSTWVTSTTPSATSGVSRTMLFARDKNGDDEMTLRSRTSPRFSPTYPPDSSRSTKSGKGLIRSWLSGGGGALQGKGKRKDDESQHQVYSQEPRIDIDDRPSTSTWGEAGSRDEQSWLWVAWQQHVHGQSVYPQRSHKRATGPRSLDRPKSIHWLTDARVERLEIFIWVFAFTSLFMGSLLAYHTIHARNVRKSKAWHFTIPILSPFTSVVEHESSVVGSRTMIIWGCIAAVLVYFMFRFWLSRSSGRGRG